MSYRAVFRCVAGCPGSYALDTVIYRCPVCQIALWSDYGQRPKLRFVRVSTIDEAASIKPDAHIFIRSKLPWVIIPDDMPAFEIYYDMNALWPADSLKRREALLGPGK